MVFCSGLGTLLQTYLVRKVVARIWAVAMVPVIRIHDRRLTAATLMLLLGVNVEVVSERLGRASSAITLTTDAHVLPSMQEDAAAALESMLRSAAESAPANAEPLRAARLANR